MATFAKNWAIFYSSIWSHWLISFKFTSLICFGPFK